jgi:hypothetical protein
VILALSACKAAKDAPWLTALSPEQHREKFPITSGDHAGADCDWCHGDFDTFREFTCIKCHDHEQSLTDPFHLGVPGYVYEGESCLGCHPTGEGASVVFHEPFFPIGPGTTHPEQRCADCHPDPRSDPLIVACIDCHSHAEAPMRERHAAVVEYRWETAACLSCHPDGVGLDRDSHTIFPIAAGTKHEATRCAECHLDPQDRSLVDCILCHAHEETITAGAHLEVGGYRYQSSGCLRCHYDGSVARVAEHRPFRIDRGARHHGENCLECHPAVLPDRPFGADFSLFDCTPCHPRGETDGHHDDVSGYRYDSLTCVQSGCHTDGGEP